MGMRDSVRFDFRMAAHAGAAGFDHAPKPARFASRAARLPRIAKLQLRSVALPGEQARRSGAASVSSKQGAT